MGFVLWTEHRDIPREDGLLGPTNTLGDYRGGLVAFQNVTILLYIKHEITSDLSHACAKQY